MRTLESLLRNAAPGLGYEVVPERNGDGGPRRENESWLQSRIRTELANRGLRLRKPFPSDFPSEHVRIIDRVVPSFTMTTRERVAALLGAVDYTLAGDIPGAFVECGVWRGGSMMAAALRLLDHGVTTRDLYLFDTFAGMTPPTDADAKASGGTSVSIERQWSELQRGDHNDWCYASLDEVRSNLLSTGYNPARLHFVKGPVEVTLPDAAPDEIALLRLDTDFYESTRHELEHLFPRLHSRGLLIIDDYGGWAGARRAVDGYFAESPVYLARIDGTGRVAVKP